MTRPSNEPAPESRNSFGAIFATLLAAGVAAGIAWRAAAPVAPVDVPVDIRFCNETRDVLGAVVTARGQFGDIAPGRCSDFARLDRAYPTIGFAASVAGRRHEMWPEDHLDEPLAAGHYTFAIRATGDGLVSVLLGADVREPEAEEGAGRRRP